MLKISILGSSNAVPDQIHDHTHFVIEGNETLVLVDCGSNPLVKLGRLGLSIHKLSDIIITHFHPDHVGGLASLLMDMWLLGKEKPVSIHGLPETLEKIESMMDLYDWKRWQGFYPVVFHPLSEHGMGQVLVTPEMEIESSKMCHMIPSVGIRVKAAASGKVLAYSSDTEPCEQVIQLAWHADDLFHEANGAGIGHSSAFQAGETASKAGVKNLYLIHYPTGDFQNDDIVREAATRFDGIVKLAVDNLTIEL